MNLIQRVKDILLKPAETWPQIEAESSDTASLYTSYIMIIAAIPAIAGFIGLSLFGARAFGVVVRIPIVTGLIQMAVGYVLSLVMIYVMALIANALAPTFGGQKNPLNALKLAAYGSTAGMVGGIFNLLPMLSILGLLAAIYSIYLIYTGLPVLMKNPQEKSVAYTAVLVICGLLAGLVIGVASAMFTPKPAMQLGGSPNVTIETPQGTVKFDTQKLEDWSNRMEAASKKMEAAQQSGDQAAIDEASREMMQIMGEHGQTAQ